MFLADSHEPLQSLEKDKLIKQGEGIKLAIEMYKKFPLKIFSFFFFRTINYYNGLIS